MIIPRIISVSGFAVLFKSTSTLATIALEEMVVIPATMSVSATGNPEKIPIISPSVKLMAI
ncbi:hypothetical protein D3C78_1878140 [compost metagenome]